MEVYNNILTHFQMRKSRVKGMHSFKSYLRDVPGSPVVKTSPSNAGGAGLIPGGGAKIPHASWPKNQNIKQKQYCNKFNKDLKKKKLSEFLEWIMDPFLHTLWNLHISLVLPHFSNPGIPQTLPKDLDSWLRFCHFLCPTKTKRSLRSSEQVRITYMFFLF